MNDETVDLPDDRLGVKRVAAAHSRCPRHVGLCSNCGHIAASRFTAAWAQNQTFAPSVRRRRSGPFYWAVTPGRPWTFVTGGGFHLPVSTSDFGA
jgi:hypothetical protein